MVVQTFSAFTRHSLWQSAFLWDSRATDLQQHISLVAIKQQRAVAHVSLLQVRYQWFPQVFFFRQG